MKTLREMMDQLDEISRRDLLKGAGAAAVGVATGSNAQASKQTFTPQQIQYIDNGLRLWNWLKSFGGDTKPYGLRVKRALDKIAKLPGGKDLLVSRWNVIRQENLNDEQNLAIGAYANEVLKNLESIVEFDESIEHVEEASPAALAKIDELTSK